MNIFLQITLIKTANTVFDRSAALVLSVNNIMQLHWHPPNPARNLAGDLAGFPKNSKIPDLPEPKSIEQNKILDSVNLSIN